ncbi:hypothetical protein DDR33_21170 [Pararcticibacter amylolyticus]|uniref:Uncharacterized protein n=1 Tax=Pararcticibacter amylolyticus TaxID=2173175 RepID=A0A2U2PBR2_9SPHI|nr:hypothetical protein DDR33_21170 [Pararcticibacter amylolyticus]
MRALAKVIMQLEIYESHTRLRPGLEGMTAWWILKEANKNNMRLPAQPQGEACEHSLSREDMQLAYCERLRLRKD